MRAVVLVMVVTSAAACSFHRVPATPRSDDLGSAVQAAAAAGRCDAALRLLAALEVEDRRYSDELSTRPAVRRCRGEIVALEPVVAVMEPGEVVPVRYGKTIRKRDAIGGALALGGILLGGAIAVGGHTNSGLAVGIGVGYIGVIAGVLTYALGGPLAHLRHHKPGTALASFAMRVCLPLASILVGFAVNDRPGNAAKPYALEALVVAASVAVPLYLDWQVLSTTGAVWSF
jgi:hypothetical protein